MTITEIGTVFRRAGCGAALALALAACTHRTDPLEQGFLEPPAKARPQVWWHWMSGNVTAEGARLDLEWMQRMGIGGVHAFAGGRLEPTFVEKPLPFMTPGWRDAYRQAVTQARRQGMEVTIAGSPGWSQTGGPWVEPGQAMKKYVWSETQVFGGKPVGFLPHPPETLGHFQARPRAQGFGPILPFPSAYGDAAVFAFPTPEADILPGPDYRSNAGPLPALASGPADLSGAVPLPLPDNEDKPYVDIDFGKARAIRALTVSASPLPAFQVLASDDGRTFRPIATIAKEDAEFPSPQQTYALPATEARVLRVLFERPRIPPLRPGRPKPATPPKPIREILIHRLEAVAAARVNRFEAKAGFQSVADFTADATPEPGPGATVDPGSVIDLTARLRPDGTLDWTPPAGRWTVVRLGWSLTGQANNPAEDTATGLEVDKLDAGAVRGYVDKLFSMYGKDVGTPLGPDGIGGLLTDSWEAGAQNWTPAMLAEFTRRRGYDPMQWLPVLTGRVVKDARASDAFLFDFQQTLKDLLTANHYGVLARAAHERGMTYYTEAQGDVTRLVGDGLTIKAQSDIPTAEFWYRPFSTDPGQPPLVADLREAASAAHLYGKDIVAAEALTVAAGTDPWAFSPAMLKPIADEIFAHGANRMLLHESHLQPYADRKPGLTLGFFGQYFNRNDTWAEYARPWTDYLAATSFMLQQGHAVSDVAYFYGEDQSLTQRYTHRFNEDVPSGFAYDYVDANALTKLLKVRGGEVVTDSGMRYRVIYLPAYVERMTLGTIGRLEQLVREGAVLVGRKPVGGLGLASPDDAVRVVADRVWGAGTEAVRRVGRGRVHTTSDLGAALRAESMAPDVEAPAEAKLMTLHRRTANADIYFVSNRSGQPLRARMRFRAIGEPKLWTADDRRVQPLAYRRRGAFTEVDLNLDPNGAGFVVFRPSKARSLSLSPPTVQARQRVEGPWQLTFEPNRGAPTTAIFPSLTDWSRSDDRGIRYFSGAATYARTITVDRSMLAPGTRLYLDLGTVHELARVTIDGREIATAWKPPYRIDLTGKVGEGVHELKIEVVNLWVNRLIGDKQPGAKAITYAPQSPYTADSALLPSGLLGPVELVRESWPPSTTGERSSPAGFGENRLAEPVGYLMRTPSRTPAPASGAPSESPTAP